MDEQQQPSQTSGLPFGVAFIVVVAAAVAFALMLRESTRAPSRAGRPAPQIKAEGWLNGPGPTEEDLRGKVIVVDAWAYWCGPCRRDAPALVALYDRYHDQGVVFLGLTTEGQDADAASREFLKATRITWPNGYGAVETLQALNAEFIPQKWVIDRKNRLIWDENSREPIEAAIDHALKEAP